MLKKVWGTIFIVVGVIFFLYSAYDLFQILLINKSNLPHSTRSVIFWISFKDGVLLMLGIFGAIWGSSLISEQEEQEQEEKQNINQVKQVPKKRFKEQEELLEFKKRLGIDEDINKELIKLFELEKKLGFKADSKEELLDFARKRGLIA